MQKSRVKLISLLVLILVISGLALWISSPKQASPIPTPVVYSLPSISSVSTHFIPSSTPAPVSTPTATASPPGLFASEGTSLSKNDTFSLSNADLVSPEDLLLEITYYGFNLDKRPVCSTDEATPSIRHDRILDNHIAYIADPPHILLGNNYGFTVCHWGVVENILITVQSPNGSTEKTTIPASSEIALPVQANMPTNAHLGVYAITASGEKSGKILTTSVIAVDHQPTFLAEERRVTLSGFLPHEKVRILMFGWKPVEGSSIPALDLVGWKPYQANENGMLTVTFLDEDSMEVYFAVGDQSAIITFNLP